MLFPLYQITETHLGCGFLGLLYKKAILWLGRSYGDHLRWSTCCGYISRCSEVHEMMSDEWVRNMKCGLPQENFWIPVSKLRTTSGQHFVGSRGFFPEIERVKCPTLVLSDCILTHVHWISHDILDRLLIHETTIVCDTQSEQLHPDFLCVIFPKVAHSKKITLKMATVPRWKPQHRLRSASDRLTMIHVWNDFH